MTFGLSWDVWKPIYEAILADFGYDRADDELARDELLELCSAGALGPNELPDVRGERVTIAGGADSLMNELDRVDTDGFIFAASTATAHLSRHDVKVDLHVTDLDKDVEVTIQRTQQGDPVALHAHGDNREFLSNHVPHMDTQFLLPTTQTAPRHPVQNTGGFTDGDRAAFIADALGAAELAFVGWDFDDDTVSAEKQHKLQWAERLLHWLECRRSEQFQLLDERRDGIDISDLPSATDVTD